MGFKYCFYTVEFQSLLLETVRQSVTGGLDIDETIGFFNELMALLVS